MMIDASPKPDSSRRRHRRIVRNSRQARSTRVAASRPLLRVSSEARLVLAVLASRPNLAARGWIDGLR